MAIKIQSAYRTRGEKVQETSATLCDIAFSRPVSEQYCSAGTAGPIIERTYAAVPNYDEVHGTFAKDRGKSDYCRTGKRRGMMNRDSLGTGIGK